MMKVKLKPEVIEKMKAAAPVPALADRFGVSRQTIYNMYDGVWDPKQLQILCEIAWLTFGTLSVRLIDLLDEPKG